MFRENQSHEQSSLFGMDQLLPESRQKKLEESKHALFYELIFKNIPEPKFACLYSTEGSRPNSPVNRHVGAEILKHMHGWTDEEMFDHVDFDLKTRYALGMQDVGEKAFCPATHYNFRKRLVEHERETGKNLMEVVFDELTESQLEMLEIETGIQRMDSFQAMSSIRRYTRLQLVIEVLQRVWRILDEEDQSEWESRVEDYIGSDSGTILYHIPPEEYEDHLETVGKLYRDLYEALEESYGETEVFGLFERVYHEQFAVVQDQVRVRDDDEMDSSTLQSPDDAQATYRHKQGDDYVGQAVNVMETCGPDDEVQLIDDVFVKANNVDDSEAFGTRVSEKPDRYEKLEELHVDGAYGSESNDRLCEKLDIDMIQTAIRGRPPDVRMKMVRRDESQFEVSCPNQTVSSEPTRTRQKAVFDSSICEGCPLVESCPTQNQQQGYVYYFEEDDVRRSQRLHRRDTLPEKRQTLRPNVEATVKEFYRNLNHKGKLRVKGQFKTVIFALCTAIGINLERIHRFLLDKNEGDDPLKALKQSMKSIGLFLMKFAQNDSNWEIFSTQRRRRSFMG